MLSLQRLAQEKKGSALILAIVILVAVSALGVTMITLGKNQVDMATNQKDGQIARYNADSCTVAVSKLIRMVVDASGEGVIGVATGSGTQAKGMSYQNSLNATQFANKVLYGTATPGICEDVALNPLAISGQTSAATSGQFTIFPTELDAAADIRSTVIKSVAGTASREHMHGVSSGLGEGGAGGGGTMMKFVIACRGRGPGNALHVDYAVYRKILGIGKGN